MTWGEWLDPRQMNPDDRYWFCTGVVVIALMSAVGLWAWLA